MAEKITIARPYARAIFEEAFENNALMHWSSLLQLAAAIAADPAVLKLYLDPKVTADNLTDLFLAVGANRFDDKAKNLIKLLANRRRLNVLPEISELFETFKAQAEQVVHAEVQTAKPLSEAYKAKLEKALERHCKKKVTVNYMEASELIGGVEIKMGDKVIADSVRDKLNRLQQALIHG